MGNVALVNIMYSKKIIRFSFDDIRNNQGLSKCCQPWSSALALTMVLALITLNIAKPLSIVAQ